MERRTITEMRKGDGITYVEEKIQKQFTLFSKL